jgi:hypothetical protein
MRLAFQLTGSETAKGSPGKHSIASFSLLQSFRLFSLLAMTPLVRAALLLVAIMMPVQSLYFYLETSAQKCFLEELPKDTMLVGMRRHLFNTNSFKDTTRPNSFPSK